VNAEDRRVRSLRPAVVRPLELERPLDVLVEEVDVLVEEERTPEGAVRSATVFLLGAECPFTCVFCDLWRHTVPGPTPRGALPAQLDVALAALPSGVEQLKLYNASNFFEPRAVPDADREAILERIAGFERVVVESHPRLLGERAAWWATRLGHGAAGRLEVALGLETVHPGAFERLNKGAVPADYERAARRLRELGLGLRCFVLVGVPFVEESEQVEWVLRTVRRAREIGARVASLIPVRGGNGELERLRAAGSWRPPSLDQFEACVDAAIGEDRGAQGGMVVQADPWDLETLGRGAHCSRCVPARVDRLRRINQLGVAVARIECPACGVGAGARR
jgi:hypothetical protein